MQITINQLEREATSGIITTVHWSASKTKDEHKASCFGSVGLIAGGSIIPFADVTEAHVMVWLDSSISFSETEAGLDTQLEALANPSLLTGIPWGETAWTE